MDDIPALGETKNLQLPQQTILFYQQEGTQKFQKARKKFRKCFFSQKLMW